MKGDTLCPFIFPFDTYLLYENVSLINNWKFLYQENPFGIMKLPHFSNQKEFSDEYSNIGLNKR